MIVYIDVMLKVLIENISKSKDFQIPDYQSDNSSGIDLIADISKPKELESGQFALIPTGIKLKIPIGYEGQIRPRSGLALNYGLTILNSPGTIDADYRGEIKVILINHGNKKFIVKPKLRIAQLVFLAIKKINFVRQNVDTLETKRSNRGFGSTGK